MTQRLVILGPGSAPALEEVQTPPGALTLVAAELLPLDLQVAAGRLPSVQPQRLAAGQVAVARDGQGRLLSVQGGVAGMGLGAPAGTFATAFAATAASTVPLPVGLDPLVAAAGVSSALAARLALDAAGAGPGSRVAVTGARGAVGSAACEIATARGCTVIPLSRDGDPGALAGATPDVIIDCAAGPLLLELIRHAAPRARHVIVGYVDGGRVDLPLPLLLAAEHRLLGFNLYRTERERFDAAHRAALDDLAAGTVRIAAARRETLPLDRAPEAFAGARRVLLVPPE